MSETVDPFRARYVPQSKIQQDLVRTIQDTAEELHELYRKADAYDVRCSHLGRTKLEESYMWIVKGITSVRPKA